MRQRVFERVWFYRRKEPLRPSSIEPIGVGLNRFGIHCRYRQIVERLVTSSRVNTGSSNKPRTIF